MNSGKVIIGIAVGLAAGAALGMLFSPKKGSELRKSILKKGEDITEDLEEKFSAFMSGLLSKYENASHEAKIAAKSGVEKVERTLKEASIPSNNS